MPLASRITRAAALTLIAALALAPFTASAQSDRLPDGPIRIVVPFTAGGNVDIVARIVAQALADDLKASVIVENKPGANAIIGAESVARSPADGRTLLFGTAETHAINPHIYRKLAYDPLKDFVTVGVVDSFPFALVSSPTVPAASLGDFVRYAKDHGADMNYATWGVGSTSQIAFEQLKQVAGFQAVHVPFKGAAPAITAVAGGEVQAFMVPLSVARPQAQAGRVRILAVTSESRDESAPDVPTAREQGVPVVIGGWHVLAAPRGTPAATVKRLNQALNAATGAPAVRERLLKQGVQPASSTPEAAQAMVEAEWRRWGDVAKAAAISAD